MQDARFHVTSYQYESQIRLTTIAYLGTVTTPLAYGGKRKAAVVADERGNRTTERSDAMRVRLGFGFSPREARATWALCDGGASCENSRVESGPFHCVLTVRVGQARMA